jgi:hypothetical protein
MFLCLYLKSYGPQTATFWRQKRISAVVETAASPREVTTIIKEVVEIYFELS